MIGKQLTLSDNFAESGNKVMTTRAIKHTTPRFLAKCRKLFAEGWNVKTTKYDCIILYKNT